MKQQHFVTFYSPGTFVAETTERPIASWDVQEAVVMSKKIHERYNAKPYSFQFSTRARTEKDLDSKVVKRSNLYYLAGTVETLEQVEARNDPKEEILRSNMRRNGYKRVVTTQTPWRWTQPLNDTDIVLSK
jgi:hypothetical protein